MGEPLALNWRTQSLRTVIFTRSDQPNHEAKAIYSRVVQSEPESYGGQGPVTVAAGLRDGLRISVNTQPFRIDLALSAIDPPENMMGQPPPIGDVEAATELLRSLSLLAVEGLTVIRAAAHRNLEIELQEGVSGAVLLNEIFRKSLFSEEDADLIYQVNRKRASAVEEGLQINRLGRWRTEARNVLLFRVGQDGGPPTAQGQAVSLLVFSADVNTALRDELLINPGPVTSELIDIAAALAAGGPDAL